MNIKNLLEYAKVDNEFHSGVKAFQKLPIVKEYNANRNLINKAMQAIEKLNKDAEDTIKQMNSVTSRYNEVLTHIQDTEACLMQIEDENEADYYIKRINSYISTLTQLASEAKTISEKIVSQKEQYKKLMDAGKNATKIVKEKKAEYMVCLEEHKKFRTEYESKLETLAKGLTPEELAKYKQVAKDDKYPVIHVLHENYCYCRIEMPGSVTQKVKAQGWGICPDCGRILISEDAYVKATK